MSSVDVISDAKLLIVCVNLNGPRGTQIPGKILLWVFLCRCLEIRLTFKLVDWGLPWWYRGWESTYQRKGHEFDLWSGEIPHASEKLNPCSTTTEPAPLQQETHAPQLESGSCCQKLEKVPTKQQRRRAAKNKIIFFLIGKLSKEDFPP